MCNSCSDVRSSLLEHDITDQIIELDAMLDTDELRNGYGLMVSQLRSAYSTFQQGLFQGQYDGERAQSIQADFVRQRGELKTMIESGVVDENVRRNLDNPAAAVRLRPAKYRMLPERNMRTEALTAVEWPKVDRQSAQLPPGWLTQAVEPDTEEEDQDEVQAAPSNRVIIESEWFNAHYLDGILQQEGKPDQLNTETLRVVFGDATVYFMDDEVYDEVLNGAGYPLALDALPLDRLRKSV